MVAVTSASGKEAGGFKVIFSYTVRYMRPCFKKGERHPVVATHTFNPSTWEAEAWCGRIVCILSIIF